ncbi:UPF0434 protein BOV_A0835-like [Octopus sinensis]|uniref:Protein preY, mitochondrial n=1 Tax=Octopus sinensis TaxID=2607531 RepID=A0A6P7TW21_9MOLL|nr:UPF0434 protein BOV_A0835-like [Octopus sinensis]XP_036370775.1 UPF0434 protein BOV_A0835-like [Octopus sinensis]
MMLSLRRSLKIVWYALNSRQAIHCSPVPFCECKPPNQFDVKMLDILVCPLSKKPLRYDAENEELVCEELQVAYPITDGIPNLVPTDARMLNPKQQEQ